MKTKFQETLSRAHEVIFRYPMILVMALLASIGAILMFENNNEREEFLTFSKFTICSSLGISLMFALKMFSQRIGKTLLLQLSGIAFLIGFYLILPSKEKEFTEVYGFIIAVTFILTHLLVSFVPFLEKNKELNFWQYNKNLFINIFLTAVFTGVLTGGVELAILAVDKLFDFDFNDRLYTNTFYVLAIFGSSFIFLLFNDKGLNNLEKDGNYPVVLKFFTQFVLIPLLFIYVVILYFYSIKILINWELPRGWVSYLVLAYSIVGILALLLVYPLKEENSKSWVRVFSKAFYYTIIPLVILLFVAIFTRILEYGYTEPRYFVLLLALWLLSTVIYFIFNKKASIKFIPISLFVFGVFSLIFPYFNAFSVAKRSQANDLMKILNENQLLNNGKINFKKKNIKDSVALEIGNKFSFLSERKEDDFLLELIDIKTQKDLAEDIKDKQYYSLVYSVKNEFSYLTAIQEESEYVRITIMSKKNVIDIQNYQYMIDFQYFSDEKRMINNDEFKLINDRTNNDKNLLKVTLNSNEETDFTSEIDKLFQQNNRKRGNIYVEEISIEKDLGKYHIKIIFPSISREKSPNNRNGTINYDNAILLIREK